MKQLSCIHGRPIGAHCSDCDNPVDVEEIKALTERKSCPDCGTNMVKKRIDWFCNHCGHTTCGSC